MTDRLDFETRLEERLRARAALASRPFDAAAIARQAVAVNGQGRRLGRLAWPSSRPALGWLVMALLLAIALLGAVAGVGALLREEDQFPARIAVAEQIVEAVSTRNPEAMRSLLTEDGVLQFPAVDTRGGGEGVVYMTDQAVSEAFGTQYGWMEILDTYWGGMEAHLGPCRSVAAAAISCDVRTRWRTLQIEIGEAWTFEFEGARVARLEMLRVDPDPPNRLMPLALADLSAWEAWLREAHPAQADRLLFEDDGLFAHLYFRYDWTNPDEIGDSITEYLQSRDPLVGSYVCSEDGNPASAHEWEVREDGTIIRGPDEAGKALSAGTWSRSNGRLFTDFQGGMTFFTIDGDRLVGPAGAWTCTRGKSK